MTELTAYKVTQEGVEPGQRRAKTEQNLNFSDLKLHPHLLEKVRQFGFTELTEIQKRCFEPILQGRDIAGISKTGTGKTLAFLLPIVNRLLQESHSAPAVLVLAPTRELCLQIAEEAERLVSNNSEGLQVCSIYGGENYAPQEAKLAKNPEIVVATPGRLIDFIRQKKFNPLEIRFFILDEADRMFDMGFIRDIRYIMHKLPPKTQSMIFSATISYYVLRLAANFMKNPLEVRIESDSVAVDKIEQKLLHLGVEEKDVYLVNQIGNIGQARSLVFTNFRYRVPQLVGLLQKYGITATGISSLLNQKKRLELLKNFKMGRYSVLIATDVASRGIDVEDIEYIFNYDLPQDAETYVHRIGRTARAGKYGTSISYCSQSDWENLPRIERLLKEKIPVEKVNSDYLQFPRQVRPLKEQESNKEHKNRYENRHETGTVREQDRHALLNRAIEQGTAERSTEREYSRATAKARDMGSRRKERDRARRRDREKTVGPAGENGAKRRSAERGDTKRGSAERGGSKRGGVGRGGAERRGGEGRSKGKRETRNRRDGNRKYRASNQQRPRRGDSLPGSSSQSKGLLAHLLSFLRKP